MRTADEIKGRLAQYLLEGTASIGLGDVMAARVTLAEAEDETRKAMVSDLLGAIFKVSPLRRKEGRFIQGEGGILQQAVVYHHSVFVLNPAEVDSFIEWLTTEGGSHEPAEDKH